METKKEYTKNTLNSANTWWNDLSQENQMLELSGYRKTFESGESTFTMKDPSNDEIVEMYCFALMIK